MSPVVIKCILFRKERTFSITINGVDALDRSQR